MIQLEVTSPSTNPTSPSTELLAIGASVPIGQRGQVIVEGLNDTATTQKMGISWVIKDPDGLIPAVGGEYEYSVWEAAPNTPAGKTHTFSGGYFDLDKEGTYTIVVNLLMNPDSPVVVDSYEGDLCVVEEEVPPECTIDADCPEGYVCVNGVCVPEEPPDEVKMEFTVSLTNIFTGTARWRCTFANKERTLSFGGMADVGEGILFSVDYDEGYIGVELWDIDGKTIYSADTFIIFRPTNGATHYWDCLTHTIDGIVGEPNLIPPDLASPYTPPEFIYVPPEEEEEKEFPWGPVLIGTGAVIAIAGLAAARK